MKSIRRHLTTRLLATVLAVSAAAGALLWAYARSRLTAEFDRGLAAEAHAVSSLVLREGDGRLEFNFPEADSPSFAGRHPDYFEIWHGDGRVFARSVSLRGLDLSRPEHPGAADVLLPNHKPGRSVAARFVPHAEADDLPPAGAAAARSAAGLVPMLVVLARDRRPIDQTLRVLASSLLLAAGALAIGTVVAVTLTVGRGLLPLHRLGAQADAIAAASLDYRFSSEGLPIELRPICDRLNGLMDRVEQAFARERRFTADVAHELRTPIAELKALSEVALRWPEDAAHEQNYRDALHIATHMQSLVGTLLAIARCQSGATGARATEIDLCRMVQDAWKPHEVAAHARELGIRWEVPRSAMGRAQPDLLAPLLSNLFANAVAHAEAPGCIECEVRTVNGWVELTLSNPCAGLGPEDLQHVFEPFWRKDAARTSGEHCGLGLSLVAAYAAAMGAQLSVELPTPESFRIRVRLPAGAAMPLSRSAASVEHVIV